jgi:hypothetical protein
MSELLGLVAGLRALDRLDQRRLGRSLLNFFFDSGDYLDVDVLDWFTCIYDSRGGRRSSCV